MSDHSTDLNPMDLSIIVVNYNSKDHLRRCLQSILDTVEGFTCEIIVVDNASWDGSVNLVREEFPHVCLIANTQNLGFSRGNNQGIKMSRGRYVLLLNNDTQVLPGALRTMIDIMDRSPGTGLLGGRLLNADGTLQHSFGLETGFISHFFRKFLTNLYEEHKNPVIGKFLEWGHASPREAHWIRGACMFFRRQALFDAGLMDENFFMYLEEVDLSISLMEIGWKIHYTPEAQIIHYGGVSSSTNLQKAQFEYRRSQLYFFKKHYGSRALIGLKIYLYLKMLKNYWWCALKEKFPGTGEDVQRDKLLCRDMLNLIRDYS